MIAIKQKVTLLFVGILFASIFALTVTSVSAMQIWGNLDGTVTDAESGDPISGVTITATADVISDAHDSGTTTTDASGQYLIEDLNGNHPVGKSYTVKAEKTGYVTQEITGVLIYSANDPPTVVTTQDFQLQRSQVNAVYGSTPELDGTISAGEWDDAEVPEFFTDLPVAFMRNCSHLHVLFMRDYSDGPPSGHENDYKDYDGTAIIFDLDNDGGSNPDIDDIMLRVYLNGSLREMKGTGSGWEYVTATGWEAFVGWAPNGYDAVVEYSIPYSKIGVTSGDAKIVGMSFGSYRLDRMGDLESVWWPKDLANPSMPDTWGDILFPPKATIESCDSIGVTKNAFNVGENLYVKGSGYEKEEIYMVYITKDLTWNEGMTIPMYPDDNYIWAVGFQSSNTGTIGPSTFIWLELVPGKYDIVVDFNDDGVYDGCVDALDDFDVDTAGFFVVPEVSIGSIMALAAMFVALGLYAYKRREKKSQ